MKKELVALAVAMSFMVSSANAEGPYNLAWTRQLGTFEDDQSRSAAVDADGNIFISGITRGDLYGSNAGSYDAFLSKYDTLGNPVWTRQLGTSDNDNSWSVATDADGNIVISGITDGYLYGPSAGGRDAFIRKYDTAGNPLWTRQLGTSSLDSSNGVAVDTNGNIFISGHTFGSLGGQTNVGGGDAFVSKYDASGNPLWTRLLGTSDYDVSMGVAADADGNVFISGFTEGDLYGFNAGPADSYDAFLSKYDTSGNPLWTRQLGTSSYDLGTSVASDGAGNVFISGYTDGDLDGTNAGSHDAFLSKYDTLGNPVWTRQLGTSDNDVSWAVATDAVGNIFISGLTEGDLYGSNAGGEDAFLSKYDTLGNLLWTHQIGTSSNDDSRGMAVDVMGNVFISGYTFGSLGGQPIAGNYDAFVVKYNVPEPATLGLLLVGGLALLGRRRQGQN